MKGDIVATETELKLHLDASGLRHVQRHRLVQSLKQGKAKTKTQISVYFDTPDFRLRDAGAVLRVRHIGTRRIQTLKTLGVSLGGAWARGEWEADIETDNPDLTILRQTEMSDLFSDERLKNELIPLFRTEVLRTTYQLAGTGWRVELAIDRGCVVTESAQLPISEIELELMEGEPRRLFDIALELQRGLPGRLSLISKAERGYALVEKRLQEPRKAEPIILSPTATVGEALKVIAHSCAGQLLANADCLLDTSEPEAIHQMRIAVRRLKSAMNIFRDMIDTSTTAHLKEELNWLLESLGRARDLDVFIGDILDPVAEIFTEEPGFFELCEEFRTIREHARAQALATLRDPRCTQLFLALGQWSEGGDWWNENSTMLWQPVRDLANSVLQMRHRKAHKHLRHLCHLSSDTRHAARINVKKLRYAVDFFCGAVSKP